MPDIHTLLLSVSILATYGYGAEVEKSFSDKRDTAQPAIVLDHIVVTTGGAAVNVTEGWTFTVNRDLWVVALGVWDSKRNGLREEHPVAIWDASGELVLEAGVPAGAYRAAAVELDISFIRPCSRLPSHQSN